MEPDTIVVRATPPGRGAVALIRLSGARAREIIGRMIEADDADGLRGDSVLRPRHAHLRTLRNPQDGELLDRAVVVYYPGPKSYTGEDVVEISTHGGEIAPTGVLETCVRLGARAALPGEFTQRAWLNGKLDLIQAEAIHDLVEGRTRMARATALHQMEGGLSRRIAEIREGLVELEALLVHHLDFPEEDDPPVPVSVLQGRAERLAGMLDALRRTAPEGLLLREGALVVLAGPPNAGKSSLFNALAGEERAIVTDVPGTTRDAIEVPLSIGGFPFRLVDTAGLRAGADVVERKGIEVARRYLAEAQIVLYCHPTGEAWSPEEEEFVGSTGEERLMVLSTKADRSTGEPAAGSDRFGALRVSVRTGEGIGELRDRLRERVFHGLDARGVEGGVVTRRRQLEGIERALDELESFGEALAGGIPVEMAATHLRPAESALEELLGILDPEEVLDRVFRDFCVGK